MVGDLEVNMPEKASSEAVQFLQKLFGSVTEASEFLGDKIRYVRWKSAVKRMQNAANFAKQAGLNPKEVPVKFLVPFLEKASLEEDESELAELWSKLLANASHAFAWKQTLFPELLSQMGPSQALLLKTLVNSAIALDGLHKDSLIYEAGDYRDEGFLNNLATNLSQLADVHSAAGDDESESLNAVLTQRFRDLIRDKSMDNCFILNICIRNISGNILLSQYLYPEAYDEIRESSAMLERLGLVERREKSHGGASFREVIITCIKATSLGFDLVANCDHVPAKTVVVPTVISTGRMLSIPSQQDANG